MPQLSIHAASEEERLIVYHNVHEMWGDGVPVEAFVAKRLKSIRHNRSTTWVLTVDGEVASSLGCHR